MTLSNILFATPQMIIVVRHADKLLEPASKWQNRKNIDRTLNAKGIVRSVKLAHYILRKFGKPDFIFASTPINKQGKTYSLREVETAGPIASMLAQINPHGFKMLYPYSPEEYRKLGDFILKQKQFDQKVVLIIWEHRVLPAFIQYLGVKQTLPPWAQADFDTVYILNYAKSTPHLLTRWERLEHQYPVSDGVTWEKIENLGDKH